MPQPELMELVETVNGLIQTVIALRDEHPIPVNQVAQDLATLDAQVQAQAATQSSHAILITGLQALTSNQGVDIIALQNGQSGILAAQGVQDAALTDLGLDIAALDARIIPLETPVVIPHPVNQAQVLVQNTQLETTLYSLTQPANAWSPGDILHVVTGGTMTGGFGTKTIRIRINGTAYMAVTTPSNAQHPWQLSATLAMRPGGTAALVARVLYHNASFAHHAQSLTLDLANPALVEITATTADDRDVIAAEFVSWFTASHPTV